MSKDNQVIYTLDTNCIYILAIILRQISWSKLKGFSRYFVDKVLYELNA